VKVTPSLSSLGRAGTNWRDSTIQILFWGIAEEPPRSLKDLIQLTEALKERSIGLHSLQEAVNTTSSSGQLVFHLFGALAEFERNLIRERTKAGLTAARARGRNGGRPKALDPN